MSDESAPAAAAPASPQPSCADLLAQQFPALFGAAPKPLKLRIQADIQARAPGVFSKAQLSTFLRQHTGRHGYLLALTRSSHRFDLDGAPVEPISDEHRQAARDELARRRTLRDERQAQQQAAVRQRAELLRAFESTSLTAANFCALKGIDPAQLDALLDAARREAEQRRQAPAEHDLPRGGRQPERDHPRRHPDGAARTGRR